MKKYFLAALAVLLCITGCQGNTAEGQTNTEQAALESSETTMTVTEEQTNNGVEATTSIAVSEEDSEDIVISREYKFDLDKYFECAYTEKYSLRNELEFLSDKQYDTYIRAWIFIDGIDYANESRVPDTIDVPTHWINENGEICTEYTYTSYRYVSTYQSFYEYLQSVFTQDAVDIIMSDERFLNIDGELYFAWGEAGGYLEGIEDKYELVEKNGSEVVFEYNARHIYDNGTYGYEDGTYIDTTRTIKLVKEDGGWRAELFDHLLRLNEAEIKELEKMRQQENR